MDRVTRAQKKYRELFGDVQTELHRTDPELMQIFERLVYGEVFYTGHLDDRRRVLLTVAVLATQQMLPQLKVHVKVALSIGVEAIDIRETVYQCAPFIGFPATLNAIEVINEVFRERGLALPLPAQGMVTEESRFEQGRALQLPIYGDVIRQGLQELPASVREAMPDFLTAFGFGDFATRTGLTRQERELLILAVLAALGGMDAQLTSHARGNVKVGNTLETQTAAMIHCFPYIGFPRALNAIRRIQGAIEMVTPPSTPEMDLQGE